MAKIREEDIDALRERADIAEIVSGYTTLKKSGASTLKGLCPLHSEKTPSFQVNTANGLFHCFGCQEGGNIYQFVEKVENLPFPEAVEWVARKTGFQLHYEEQRPGDDKLKGQKARLLEANKLASAFFHKTLLEAPDALQARRYLESRGFDKPVAERWQLGYAPGRNALCSHLQQKGFTRDEIVQADLGKISDRDGALFDTFRQRIIFPTWSLQGDVVGFGGRALGDQQPKYLNTAETPVFSKSKVMYGLNRAKSAIARDNPALVVEGYTDVIALHEAGIQTAVATNGVALGQRHFEELRKFNSRCILMFDADAAGAGAAERGWGIDLNQAPLFLRVGVEVMVAPLPVGRDPADVIADDGADSIEKIIDAAQPLLEFKLEQTISKLRLDTPEARARAIREAVKVLGWHPDPIARHQYIFKVARRIGVEAESIEQALQERRTFTEEGSGGPSVDRNRRVPGHVKVEKEALRLLLNGNADVQEWVGRLDENDFSSGARREVFGRLSELRTRGQQADPRMAEEFSPDAATLFTELSVSGPLPEETGADEAREVFTRLKLFALDRQIRTRRNTLQELNPLDDADRHDALFTELVQLEAERRDLLRVIQGVA
jgi:DNA primase